MPLFPKSAQTAQAITAGEAFILWSHLVTRYQNLEMSAVYQNFIHDLEFKMLVARGMRQSLDAEIKELEGKLNYYGIPLPPRPPKTINTPTNTEVIRDEFIYQQILSGMRSFLNIHTSDLRVILNDDLRAMLTGFLTRELEVYDDLIKYGKVKGWLGNPPAYRPSQ